MPHDPKDPDEGPEVIDLLTSEFLIAFDEDDDGEPVVTDVVRLDH